MQEPNVRLYAAVGQAMTPGLRTLKTSERIIRGAKVCAKPAMERNWDRQTVTMKNISDTVNDKPVGGGDSGCSFD
jgi:hypothetical protein